MKKKFIALTIALIMALGLSACGGDAPGSRNDGASGQSSEGETPGSDSGSGTGEIHTLIDWYNSDERLQVEAACAETGKAMGMTYYITVQEPDILIYNYQYIEQIDLQGASQDQIDAVYAESMQPYISSITAIPGAFREEYGIPLRIVRLVYYNADGSLITVLDITQDYPSSDSSGNSVPGATYESLQDWLGSDDALSVITDTNNSLASSGMVFRLSAEENILVYEYYVSDALGFSGLTEEELTAHLNDVVEGQRESLLSLFDLFRNEYGLTLETLRVVFFSEDGAKTLYTSDIR